jgi:GTP-binding protein HflX
VAISALTGEGVTDMLSMVEQNLYEMYTSIVVQLPFKEGGLIAAFHDQGQVNRVEQSHEGVLIQGYIPGRLLAQYKPYIISET